MLVESTFCGNKCDYSVRSNLVKRFGKEIVVNKEVFFIITLVEYAIATERDIADCCVKVIIRESSIFIASDLNVSRLIELLCDTTCNAVYLNSVQAARFTHFFGHYAEKVAYAHRRLKYIAALEAECFQAFINSIDYSR